MTNSYIANNLIKNIQHNSSQLSRTQEQLATGKSMLRPSDKPGNIGPLLSVKATLSYFEQFNRNLDDGLSYLDMNDSTMQTLGDILHQAGEMAIQGSNGTYTVADMAALGEQIDKMIDHVVDLANASVGGRYIFAGTKNTSTPFKRDGNVITYSGDTNGIFREVLSGEDYRIDAPGITTGFEINPLLSNNGFLPKIINRQLPANLPNVGMFIITRDGEGAFTISGQKQLDGVTPAPGLISGFTVEDGVITVTGSDSELEGLKIDMSGASDGDTFEIIIDSKPGVFGHGTETAPGSGVYEVYNFAIPKDHAVDEGVFDVLFRLRNALYAGDVPGTETGIAEVRDKTDQLLQRRVGIGSRTRHFEALKDQIVDIETKLADIKFKLEGADIYKLSINMSQEQVTFEASLASGANIMRVSLLDFLK